MDRRSSIKGRYAWLIGATSFVTPADVMTNVSLLRDLVDSVQLLFFESSINSTLNHPVDFWGLRRAACAHELAYTVHLPTDLRFGARESRLRQQAVDEVIRLVAELDCLAPKCYDLHLLKETGLHYAEWISFLDWSLSRLSAGLGPLRKLVGIENLDYPLDQIWPLIRSHGFSLSLDMGHAIRFQHGWPAMIKFLPYAVHIHLHGVAGVVDHLALSVNEGWIMEQLGAELEKLEFTGVVTLEMYSLDLLQQSIEALKLAWRCFEKCEE